jgi:hypothetical protein
MKLKVLALALGLVSAIDECSDAGDCAACLDPAHDTTNNCVWCAPLAVVYADGSQGPRCADRRDASHGGGWQCTGKAMTNECLPGWICGGDATGYQCIPSTVPGEGNSDYNDCMEGCTPRPSFKCTDPTTGQCFACPDKTDPACTTNYTECNLGCITESQYSCNPLTGTCDKCTEPSPSCVSASECSSTCAVKYECEYPTNFTADPTCKICTDPTSNTCKYATSDDCSAGCQWNYQCNLDGPSGPECTKAKDGIPQLKWCLEQCETTYECDEVAETCNATGTGGSFKNKTDCTEQCPTKPTPTVPPELIGIWRGLEIHNGFKRGEWTANVSLTHFTLYMPDTLDIYFTGNASFKPIKNGGAAGITGQLTITSTFGTLTGNISIIYGDSNLEPELAYVALGFSETLPTAFIKDYDEGMVTPDNKVLGMFKCKDDANCQWHLPTGIPPVPPIVTGGLAAALAPRKSMASSFVPASFLRLMNGEIDARQSDPCNEYTDCAACIAAATTAGGLNCGWCTTPVVYNDSSVVGAQCAGAKTGSASGWTCYGIYRTLSCYDYVCDPVLKQCTEAAPGTGGPSFPTLESCEKACEVGPAPYVPCSFDGVHRGIQIDLNYVPGEWDANFTVTANHTTASFEFVPTGYKYSGTVECRNLDDPTAVAKEGEFKLTLTNGTDLYGIYMQGGGQAETQGLSWALSNYNVTVPPDSFESAMPGLNSSVYGYTKCATYKKGICIF